MDKDRIRAWLVQDALPLWSSVGLDDAGGFVEQLDLQGKPEPEIVRRIRVQARQIYVYSEATRLGLGGYGDVIQHAVEWLWTHGWDQEQGGFFHRLDGTGTPVDRKKDTYDHAFILFGLAHASRAAPSDTIKEVLAKTLDFVMGTLRAPEGPGFAEGLPAAQPRRQNPHMHLLEACLALHQVTGESRFLTEADDLVAMFRDRFFQSHTETLGEFFTDEWALVDGDKGRIVEPGHHFEWVYLLHAHAEAHRTSRGSAQPGAEAAQLFEVARARGLDPVSGLAYDEIWQDGGIKSRTKRCWAQTEALRTHALLGRSSPHIAEDATAWLNRLFRYYLDPAPKGTWLDVMGEDNQPTAKAIPASTLYHLMSAFAFVLDEPSMSADTPKLGSS